MFTSPYFTQTVLGSLRRRSRPQTLQIWIHRTITLWASCWKSTIHSSHSLRRPISLKSPYRPSGKSCHKNISSRRWWTSTSAWLPTWLRLPMMDTQSISSNSVHLQVFVIHTGSFHSHRQITGEDNAQNAEKWGLSWCNSMILSVSDTIQQNLVL